MICFALRRFLLPLALLIAFSLPVSARPWTMGDPAAERQPEADGASGGFTMDQSGQYSDENLFPFPQTLETIKAGLKAELAKEFEELGAEAMKPDLDKCALQWAYTEDFDGDGTKETFFAYGLQFSFFPACGLYLIDGAGNLTEVDSSGFLEGQIIRYPGRAQLAYTGGYGTGLSYFGTVVGYEGGKVERYLSVGTAAYEKRGPYLCAYPRVGSAGQIAVYGYWWNENAGRYELARRTEIPPKALPAAARPFLHREGYTLVRAAHVAGEFYLLGFEDGEKNEYVQYLHKLPEGGIEAFSDFYSCGFDELMASPEDGPYGRAVQF